MATLKEVLIPDLGGAADITVIEILVKSGEHVNAEQSLITLEGDKATMDIPAPFAGTIADIKVKVGDKVSEGNLILTIQTTETAATSEKPSSEKSQTAPEQKQETTVSATSTAAEIKEVRIPDIGGAADVTVIEVNVKPGDHVKAEDPLITLEGDKATMDIPAPYAGEIKEIKVNVGSKVSQDDLVLTMLVQGAAPSVSAKITAAAPATTALTSAPAKPAMAAAEIKSFADVHAGPSVRQLARELGADLPRIKGTGPKGRVLKEDLYAFVKAELQKAKGAVSGGIVVPPAPVIDFTKFGKIEIKPLNKIKRLTAVNVHRSWITVPHVTQFAEADITEMEAWRKQHKAEIEAQGVKLTPLVFIMKAVVASLKAYPIFNSSLDASGENLVMKQYFHLGIAADTPNGLVVPVIRNVDQKSIAELAKELADISKKAREKGLTPAEMAGSCFTISSLGGIGGTSFTPIVNTPDVAILGVSKAAMKPVYENNQFVPRLMLPLSLSYDHRVIDGADGARFAVDLCHRLANIADII